MPDFSLLQWLMVGLLFVWTGFVRSGLGFGGAALGLTLRTRLHHVDWRYLWRALGFIVPPALVGVLGLVTLPTLWLNVFIYAVALFY